MPAAMPPAPRPRLMSTANHSIDTGATRSPTVRSASHNVLVVASTRSPTLNTGPLPASTCFTTR
jgi:hypothetical protein